MLKLNQRFPTYASPAQRKSAKAQCEAILREIKAQSVFNRLMQRGK